MTAMFLQCLTWSRLLSPPTCLNVKGINIQMMIKSLGRLCERGSCCGLGFLKDGVAKSGSEQGPGESLTHIPDSYHGRVPVCET